MADIKDILNELYINYFEDNQCIFDKVTSSHWKKYGLLTRVIKQRGEYSLLGVGFGDFIQKNSIQAWRYFLPNMRSRFLCDNYHVDNRIKALGFYVADKMNREVTFDCIKQILSFDLINKYGIFDKTKTVVIIGDGYGYMSSLVKTVFPKARIICVNLGKMLFFDVFYFEKIFPAENCQLNSMKDKIRKVMLFSGKLKNL